MKSANALFARLSVNEKLKIVGSSADGLVSLYHSYKHELNVASENEGVQAMTEVARLCDEEYENLSFKRS